MNLIINTDGASKGNPGPAAYGYIIKTDTGVILHQEGKALGETTNNFAEYSGVLEALKYIKSHFSAKAPHDILVKADSQLLVRQLTGAYKVKHPNIKPFVEKIKFLEAELGKVSYQHVPREQNFIADRLANKALGER